MTGLCVTVNNCKTVLDLLSGPVAPCSLQLLPVPLEMLSALPTCSI